MLFVRTSTKKHRDTKTQRHKGALQRLAARLCASVSLCLCVHLFTRIKDDLGRQIKRLPSADCRGVHRKARLRGATMPLELPADALCFHETQMHARPSTPRTL